MQPRKKETTTSTETESYVEQSSEEVQDSAQTLGFFKLEPNVKIPEFKTEFSSCMDLYTYFHKDKLVKVMTPTNEPVKRRVTDSGLVVHPNERVLLPTGLVLDIPVGYELKIYIRSSAGFKDGIVLANQTGVIDADYVEELFVAITNTTKNPIYIKENDRLAQIKLEKLVDTKVVELTKRPLQKSSRSGGFGHTGK